MKLFHWFELLAFITSIVVLKKTRGTALVFFIPFLLLVNVYEIGTIKGWFTSKVSNHFAGNIFMPVHFSFYLGLLLAVFSSIQTKKIVVVNWLVLMALYLINLLFIQGMDKYNSYTYLAGSLTLIGWCCYLFYRIMVTPTGLSIMNYPFFWIYTGVMFFYLFRFVFMSYFTLMAYTPSLKYIQLFKSISNISIILLYSCITTGLLCFKPPIRKI